ncbi:hypothetical protein AAG570_014104 [Ranatra chinensis]|uniref:HEAT repeat-containing protein 1 n=1 Tax=Ranatra chinensis TaxID=642074 RepID=A0ABD0XTE9_9HEMI
MTSKRQNMSENNTNDRNRLGSAAIPFSDIFFQNYFPSQGSFLSFLISALILETDLGPEYLRILKESLEEASEDPWSELVELLFSRDSVIVPGLMLMMTSETEDTRMLAIDCLEAATAAAPKHSFYMPLATEVLECQEEIRMDPNQIAVVMYTRLSPSPDIQSVFISKEARDSMRDILDRLILAVVDREATPLPVRTSLLQLIESVNSPDIYLRLLPIVDELTGKSLVLDKLESSLLVNVLRRLNETTAVCFSEADYWHFITRVLSDHSTRVQLEDAEKPALPAVILLNQISRPVFDALPDRRNNAKHLLELTVMTAVDSDSVEVGSATASMFKRLALDCSTLVELFAPMLAASVPTTATQQSPPKGKLKKKRSEESLFAMRQIILELCKLDPVYA